MIPLVATVRVQILGKAYTGLLFSSGVLVLHSAAACWYFTSGGEKNLVLVPVREMRYFNPLRATLKVLREFSCFSQSTNSMV